MAYYASLLLANLVRKYKWRWKDFLFLLSHPSTEILFCIIFGAFFVYYFGVIPHYIGEEHRRETNPGPSLRRPARYQ